MDVPSEKLGACIYFRQNGQYKLERPNQEMSASHVFEAKVWKTGAN
jgi:hypothetical protein